MSQDDESGGPGVVLAMPQHGAAGIADALQSQGYLVEVARGCSRRSGCFAPGLVVVLSDVSLPDGNCRDLVERVSLHDGEVRLILCTTERTAELWWDALDCGVSDILSLPCPASNLRRMVATWTGRPLKSGAPFGYTAGSDDSVGPGFAPAFFGCLRR